VVRQSFEQLQKRAVAVVVDPIQSVKGKVVIDAFRLINQQLMLLGQNPRQTTSNIGHLKRPSIQALVHNLNRHYYSINISYRKDELEQKMLLNIHKKTYGSSIALVLINRMYQLDMLMFECCAQVDTRPARQGRRGARTAERKDRSGT